KFSPLRTDAASAAVRWSSDAGGTAGPRNEDIRSRDRSMIHQNLIRCRAYSPGGVTSVLSHAVRASPAGSTPGGQACGSTVRISPLSSYASISDLILTAGGA